MNSALQKERASTADWMAAGAGALGALMAVLDISITNAALPTIQGSVGATGTEATWISAAYLVAESVMIPMAAWLVRVFGMRNFLLSVTVLFTLFSVMCGLSDTLPMLVIARVGQGLSGGALIPTAQTIMRTRLPPRQFALGMTIFGLTVMVGPVLGPLVGGWLTTHLSWHWCFFINLPVGVLLVSLLMGGFERERTNWRELADSDWLGIAGMALWASTMTLVLEEGQREQWFESRMIVGLCAASLLGFAMLMVSQRRSARPVVRLSVLTRNPNFARVVLLVMTVGMTSYSTAFIVPQFLAQIAHYNAEDAGHVMFYTALPALLLMPVLPHLTSRVDLRLVISGGLLCYVAGCLLNANLTAQTAGGDFIVGQLLMGAGQIMCSLPLNRAALSFVSPAEAGDAAGIYSMARNLGGSIGLAVTGTLIDRRESLHFQMLSQSLTANSPSVQERVSSMAAGLLAQTGDAMTAQAKALSKLAQQVHVQALVMTYGDAFRLLAVALLLCIPLTLILKRSAAQAAPGTGKAV